MTVRIQNFRIQQHGISEFSNQLAVSVTCAKSGTYFQTQNFQIVPGRQVICACEFFCVSLSTYLGYLSTETKPRIIIMHPS